MDNSHTLKNERNLQNSILLKEYIKNGTIKYLRVPIISSCEKNEFDKVYEVLDDFDETLNRIDYKNANIISSNPIMYNDSALLTCDSDIIIGSYSLLEFRSEVNHGSYLPTYTYLEEKQVIESEGEKYFHTKSTKYFMEDIFLNRQIICI